MPYKDPIKEKESAKKRIKKYRSKPEYKDKMRHAHLYKRFGISLEAYQVLFESQEGLCAICLQPESAVNQYGTKNLSVDHNHVTGKIRGLLCNGCNTSLGFVKENPHTLSSMIEYIKKHN